VTYLEEELPMTADEFVETATRTAQELLASGLHCSEIVARALAHAQGADSDEVRRISTGFAGGLSGRRGPCGAVTGGVIGIGLACGRATPGESDLPAMQATQEFADAFESRFGSRNCVDLTGVDLGTAQGLKEFYDKKIAQQRCVNFIVEATEIAARIIAARKS
jgi:C_GCAxxG_C_C family probable redox protein